jgi:uncharacterized protein YndB with AHSA1/START domain
MQTRRIRASRAAVYAALLDPAAVERWRVPVGMTSEVHEFELRKGGVFRVSLTYDAPDAIGKSEGRTDSYHGHFERLVPDTEVVEVVEFETSDPALTGTMRITTTLREIDGDVEISMFHEGIPVGVALLDNELGTSMALDSLANLLEQG